MQSRRRFLKKSAYTLILGSAASCRRSQQGTQPSPIPLTLAERRLVERDRRDRDNLEKRLKTLNTTGPRTTPARPINILDHFPELKARVKQSFRLHPRYTPSAVDVTQSHLGGKFLWPSDEPWPRCSKFHIPLTPILQLYAKDAPRACPFPDKTNLLQVVWSARQEASEVKIFWRRQEIVTEILEQLPDSSYALPRLQVLSCRLNPEPCLEYPRWNLLPRNVGIEERMQRILEPMKPAEFASVAEWYNEQLAGPPGCKIGGYPIWLDSPADTACPECKHPLDYVMTLDDNEHRFLSWIPNEELNLPKDDQKALARSSGLTLQPPGNRNIFICQRCEDRPTYSF